MARVERGLEKDPAVRARRDQLEAARAREREEVAIDEVELRVQNNFDDEYRLELTTRMPIPNPGEIRTRRAGRRAETEASFSRLEETALIRTAETCVRSIERIAHDQRAGHYQGYAQRLTALLQWGDDLRRTGSVNELAAMEFEIDSRVQLARREPGPPPLLDVVDWSLPPLARAPRRLVQTPAFLRKTVRAQHPSVGVRDATSAVYRALSDRAERRARPWFSFVDLSYEPVAGNRDNEVGAQIGLRIPIGVVQRAEIDRYRALGRSERREGDRIVDEYVRRSLIALREIDHFEANAERWTELLTLAHEAETLAGRWRKEGLARPGDVADLVEQAYLARVAVVAARETAGLASCSLLAMTGVALEDWPRE